VGISCWPFATLALPRHTFVDDIPVRAFALVPGHECGDVVLHNTDQRCVVGDLADPRGQLTIPDQCVAAKLSITFHISLVLLLRVFRQHTSLLFAVAKSAIASAAEKVNDP